MIFSLIMIYLTLFPLSTPARRHRSKGPSLPSYDYGIMSPLIAARQIPTGFITRGVFGGQGPNGSIPLRREVRDLEKDEDSWTLYILGMDRMQHMDQNERSSWYSLAGIHGRPFKSYDGVEGQGGSPNSGYCTHTSILFPTWHRPYLALYEQILSEMIKDIAQRYPAGEIRDRYVVAAANFRVPYWDWAANRFDGENVLPRSFGESSSINIDGPMGRQVIANPLFTYRFQPLDPAQLPTNPFNLFPETMRYPDNTNPSAVSNNIIAAQVLENSVASVQSRIYTILTNYHNYLAFSNGGYRVEAPPSEQDSLEAIHDQVHALVGGGGHMSFIDYAGFDPIFFLHHAMVDRCFAMWQILNPNSYVTPRIAVTDTFTLPVGQVQDTNTPLTPFFKDGSGNFWSSSDVRDISKLGYQYAETSDVNQNNREQEVIIAINRLYGLTPGIRRAKREVDAQSISASGNYREWLANVQMPKSAQNSPYSVYIFLGPFNDDPKYWSTDPNLAGVHTMFQRSVSMENDNDNNSPIVTAVIPLTNALIEKIKTGDLENLSVEHVTEWLEMNMSYCILGMDGTEIDEEDLPDFKITIASAEVKLPEHNAEMPVWGEMIEHG
ncbi:Tyrosinase [Erysiphe neolycopersici]|uniref:Tyrosinase n=1 Tax=Erysiphe neolycopersici TaxID=212602 RepID=A0A420HKD2_9PEZI|nr:Tyrosinase [Erysiphe neolycopersici]